MSQPPITDLDHLRRGSRSRPLVIVATRYLPHFRHEVFRRLNEHLSGTCELLFVHDPQIPASQTGVETTLLPNSVPVRIHQAAGEWHIQPRAIRLISRLNPDVFLTEASAYNLTTHICGLLQRLRRKQVIYWNKGPSPKKRHPLRRWFLGRAFRVWSFPATMLVGYGQTSREWFRQFGRRDEDIVVAQNTIDTSVILGHEEAWYAKGRAMRASLEIAPDRIVIGTVSRLITAKRVDLVIRAVGAIAQESKPVSLIIGGGGPDRSRLEAAAAEYPELDVYFVGKLDVGEDNTVFAASDLNVFAGAIGLAIVQSMALRRLTICADEPFADAELIIHEKTGLRFERFSVASLKQTIERALDDHELRARLANDAHDYISEHATIDNMAAQISRAITTALSRQAGNSNRGMEKAEELCE